MTVRQINPPILRNVSHASLLALASFQLLEPPDGGASAEATLLSSRSIIVVSIFMLWLVLPALVARWHRDDRKEVSTSLHDPKSGVTELRSFRGYDREAIVEFFRETAQGHEAKRDFGKSQESPKQDEEG